MVCIICFENFTESEKTTTNICGHKYHLHCLLLYFSYTSKKKCPLCRTSFVNYDVNESTEIKHLVKNEWTTTTPVAYKIRSTCNIP